MAWCMLELCFSAVLVQVAVEEKSGGTTSAWILGVSFEQG